MRTAWAEECDRWLQRDPSAKRYVYFWADGVYFQPHLKHDKQCLLVIAGADEIDNKDIVGLSDGYRESEQSWFELLFDLKRRGLQSLFLDAFLHLAAQAVEALVKRLAIADEVGGPEARAGALVCFLLSNRFKGKRKHAGPFSVNFPRQAGSPGYRAARFLKTGRVSKNIEKPLDLAPRQSVTVLAR